MNKEAKQFLINDLKDRITPDLFEELNEESFIKMMEILSLPVEKGWEFARDIQMAFIFCNPKYLDDKKVFPSTQAKLIKTLLGDHKKITKKIKNRIAPLKELPLPQKEAIAARKKREEHKWILLQTLRDAEVYRKTGKRVVNRYGKNLEIEEYTPRMYEFDQKIVDLMGQLSWFEEVVTLALKNVKAEVGKTKGNQTNFREWKFFIFLCNIFYKYTKKVPEIRHSDGIVKSSEALNFLHTCYEGFGMEKLTDIAAHKKFDAVNQGKQPTVLSEFNADWLNNNGTL